MFTECERHVASALILAVGFAQLARTDTEMIIGSAYILGAILWTALARINDYWNVIGQFIVGGVLFSRGAAVFPIFQTGWSGAVIIFCTWCGIGAWFMRNAWVEAHHFRAAERHRE